MAAEPVFDDISVKNTIIAIEIMRMIHKGALLILVNIDEAIQAVVPVDPKIEERHNPPPKIMRIPHPIFFSSSFHEIRPVAGANAVITIAIIWSNFFKLIKSDIWLEKIQQIIVKRNNATAPFDLDDHWKVAISILLT